MDSEAVVTQVIGALNALEIPYMLVGSLSSNAYGIPRSTEDPDFVVAFGNTLRWAISGKSRSKDINDVTDVISVQRGKLDLSFIRLWTDQHGTRELFEKLLAETPVI